MNVYTVNLTFLEVRVSVLIKPVCVYNENRYHLLIKSKQKLTESYQQALSQYLYDEGFIFEGTIEFLD